MFPCCLVVSPEAKKLAFRFIKQSFPVVWHLLLCYVLTVYYVLSNYYLFHKVSGCNSANPYSCMIRGHRGSLPRCGWSVCIGVLVGEEGGYLSK